MKNLLAILVLSVYFITSSGFVVSFHYCMDELASTRWGATESTDCGKCGMEMEGDNHCCWDDVKVVKLHTDQRIADQSIDFMVPALPVSQTDAFIVSPFYNFLGNRPFVTDEGPPLNGQDSYLHNRVFRI